MPSDQITHDDTGAQQAVTPMETSPKVEPSHPDGGGPYTTRTANVLSDAPDPRFTSATSFRSMENSGSTSLRSPYTLRCLFFRSHHILSISYNRNPLRSEMRHSINTKFTDLIPAFSHPCAGVKLTSDPTCESRRIK